MDIKDFTATFADVPSDLIGKVDTNNPSTMVVEGRSVDQVLRQYMSAQSSTTNQLISFIGERITDQITVDGNPISVAEQKRQLSQIANKSALVSRQMENVLSEHLKKQEGIDFDSNEKLINEPPITTFGIENKASDTGLKMIDTFSGDTTNVEENLTTFLRSVYSLIQTNNLSEKAANSVIIRKVSGSAQILIDSFVEKMGGVDEVTFRNLIFHLEKKFVIQSSPLHADAQLHSLQKGNLTYTQLQAKIQRLVRLATRLEDPSKVKTLVEIKEQASFLMAIDIVDREKITAENNRRLLASLPALTLDQMSTFLTQNLANRLQNEPILKVSEVDMVAPVQYAPKFQRGTPRGRFQHQRGGGRGKPVTPQETGAPPARGVVNQGRYTRGRGYNQKQQSTRIFNTSERAGVPKGACYLCGNMDHGWKDAACPYAGQELKQSPCRWCNTGLHAHHTCLHKQENK